MHFSIKATFEEKSKQKAEIVKAKFFGYLDSLCVEQKSAWTVLGLPN